LAKNLKLNIKNAQLAEALQFNKLKKEKAEEKKAPPKAAKAEEKQAPKKATAQKKEEKPKEEVAAPVAEPAKKKPVKVAPKKAAETPAPPKKEEKPAPLKPAPKGPVDDFRKPVIKKARPVKKLPITRKSAAPEKKTTAEPKAPSPGRTPDKARAPSKETPARKPGSFTDLRDLKSKRKTQQQKSFDSRDRMGLRERDDDRWRKRRGFKKNRGPKEDLTIRPKSLDIRLPITVKDLAVEMKLKASQLISKLFAQGVAVTINDFLDDETTIQLLGHEFQCEITIDTSEEERIKITDKTIKEEIAASDPKSLKLRPPVVTFMGHVDHGKTSLIDSIRKTNLAEGEAGAITQHIGAFKCQSDMGEITILDTPGHEAFSAMRERGAEVTDFVILVVAGDEGIRDQTVEAINQAKAAEVPILVAINKCDKPGFDAENIYRQLSEHELLPEAWGGTTITVNCSAVSGEGIKDLLEMLSLQSEVLELKANPKTRARGSVIESAMHKGLGSMTSLLVQNGTLKVGDNLVFDLNYARVKTMHDEHGKSLKEATPSTPLKITGLSGLPEAGSEFIVVETEKEAREIAQARQEEHKHKLLQKGKRGGLEGFLEKKAEAQEKKVLPVILRADVQGSLEALKHSLQKIKSDKAELNFVTEGVGQISESDVSLASASGATIIGFHTKVESHAEGMINEKKVNILLHDIIYHAVDDVKERMRLLLDKLPQENEMGVAEVKATFKSSQLGVIAGCQISEGIIKRNHHARVKRGEEVVWKGMIASLKRGKEDAKEVSKGLECGIVLQNFQEFQLGDLIEAYEIIYLEQEL